ncbi:hypothetical protein K8S17_00955 [bacterium]|nr:hypothetical protein [bacterium]
MKDRVVPVADVERAITELTHVRSARIVLDDTGSILEVHVIATDEHPAKQVARDVGSLFLARLEIPLDHRKSGVEEGSENAPMEEFSSVEAVETEPASEQIAPVS